MPKVNVDLKKVQATRKAFNDDLEAVKSKLRSIQSQKSKLIRHKSTADYDQKLATILEQEQLLKEVRSILEPKKTPVTQMTQADIKKLDYNSAMNARRSIQSTKCLSFDDPEKKTKCEQIEKMLTEHINSIKPIDDGLVRKSEIQAVINAVETADKMSKAEYIKLLKKLL